MTISVSIPTLLRAFLLLHLLPISLLRAQTVRQTKISIDDGSGKITTIVAPSGLTTGQTIILPAGGGQLVAATGTPAIGKILSYDSSGASWKDARALFPAGSIIPFSDDSAHAGFTYTDISVKVPPIFWIAKASMPTDRIEFGVAMLNDKMYVVGGWNGTAAVGTCEVYDPATDTWQSKTSMPTPRSGLGLVAINGKLYAYGGRTGTSTFLPTCEEYDPISDSWTAKADMYLARSEFAAVAFDGKAYALGGAVANFGYELTDVEAYDPSTNSWSPSYQLSSDRRQLSAVEYRGKLYVIGGYADDNGTYTTVEAYDPLTNSWETRASLPEARFSGSAVVVKDKIYYMGGFDAGFNTSPTTFAYDGDLDQWSYIDGMTFGRADEEIATYNNHIYTFGGYTTTRISNVEEFTIPVTLYYFTKD